MKDLSDPFWIKLKGGLFLLLGVFSAVLILIELPSVKLAALLALAVWSFCRFYYFAFYVIEHYVEPGYRFSGLWSFAKHCWFRKSPAQEGTGQGSGGGGGR